MIRPTEYWQAQGAVPGSYVLLQFPELEASGLAKVKSLAACPTIAEGDAFGRQPSSLQRGLLKLQKSVGHGTMTVFGGEHLACPDIGMV